MSDRVFTLDEIHAFSQEVAARNTMRAEGVRTSAGRALLAASRTITGKDGSVVTVSDGDVLDAIRAIEQEALG